MVARIGTQPGRHRVNLAGPGTPRGLRSLRFPEDFSGTAARWQVGAVTASEQGRLPARSPSEEIKTSWGAEDQVLSVSVRCDNVRPDGSTDDEAPPVSRAVAQEDPC